MQEWGFNCDPQNSRALFLSYLLHVMTPTLVWHMGVNGEGHTTLSLPNLPSYSEKCRIMVCGLCYPSSTGGLAKCHSAVEQAHLPPFLLEVQSFLSQLGLSLELTT
jgi:hypothetical protein